ncbi:MAG: hypothetical protein V4819_26155 [Verrucomicrobiota bacterium]
MKTTFLSHLALAALIAPALSQAPQPAFETGVMLQASSLLPAEVLHGVSYRVRDHVPTDGYMAHFTIDSDFGTFTAVGVPQALQRIREVEAIRTLVETSKSDLFAEGLKRSIEQPIDAVKHIVKNPVESVKQAPKTVGHFFGNIGSAIGRGVEKAKERSSSDEPEPTAGEVGRGIGETAKNVAGFDKAKLETAKQLKVDPYSDNARLQEEMDKVTWAFFAGGLPLRVGAAAASAGLAVAATKMVGIPEDTYALTRSELEFRDGRALAAMGITDEDIRNFQLNPALSTTRRHLIVTSLEAMPKTKGRGLLVQRANACISAEEADFLITALSILEERQRSGAADYVSLEVLGRLPGGMNAKGELEVPAPVDYVTWTQEVAGFATRTDLGAAPKVLVHTGRLSPVANTGFLTAGWKEIAVPYQTR